MKKKVWMYVCVVIGLGLAAGGWLLVKWISNPTGIMEAFPYVMVGVGCGVFGSGMGSLMNQRILKKSPDVAKKMEIEAKDERNVMLINKAKAKSFDIMTYVFGALMLSYALMNVSMMTTLLLVFAYLFVHCCVIYFRQKYEKEL